MATFRTRMGSSQINKIVFLGLLTVITRIESFNIDTKKPYIFKDSEAASYFGYSLAFHQSNKLLIGAPKSNSTGKSFGTTYRCASDDITSCTKLTQLNKINTHPNEITDEGWMGATVYSDNNMLMSCAPRYKLDYDNKQRMVGKCENINLKDPAKNFVWRPCNNKYLAEFDYCQVGFSAKLMNANQKQIVSGIPGLQIDKGSLVMAKSDGEGINYVTQDDLAYNSYQGYSTTTGVFASDEKSVVAVGGAPRGDLLDGKVVLYKVSEMNKVYKVVINPSKKFGTYFGASMAATDINNDGFADLVVGAPYENGGTYNEGAVYVYMNTASDNIELKQTIPGKKTDSLFGYAVGSVGDLNQDQHNDIAVGAPWGGESGKGVVYLYYGTANLTPLRLMQTLTPESIGNAGLRGFGFSFAEYYSYESDANIVNDVDKNNYPDLAIGAFESGEVAVLRSKPVVTVLGKIQSISLKQIDLYTDKNMCDLPGSSEKLKCIEVNVCLFAVSASLTTSTYDVKFTLGLDTQLEISKRAFVIENGKRMDGVTKQVTVASFKCERFTVYVKNTTKDMNREMEIRLSHEYVPPTTCPDDLCPVANQMLQLADTKALPYVYGCTNDGNYICNADLKITDISDDVNGLIAVGNTKLVEITVNMENAGENAFTNFLHLTYPKQLSPVRVTISEFSTSIIWEPNVSQDSDIATLSATIKSPFLANSKQMVRVLFSVLAFQDGTKSIELTATAKTKSEDMVKDNDSKTIRLNVQLTAELTISATVEPDTMKWRKGVTNENDVGRKIVHTFFYQNMGPSSVDLAHAIIKIPEVYKNKYVLNVIEVEVVASKSENFRDSCKKGIMNPMNLEISDAGEIVNSTKRKKRDVAAHIECGQKDVKCRLIECEFKYLVKSTDITVTVTSTFVDATFENVIKDNINLTAYTKFTSKSVAKVDPKAPDHKEVELTVFSPYLTKKGEDKKVEWWIILLCILAAILIIAIIVFIMYKKGFFKRKNKMAKPEEAHMRDGDPEEEEEE